MPAIGPRSSLVTGGSTVKVLTSGCAFCSDVFVPPDVGIQLVSCQSLFLKIIPAIGTIPARLKLFIAINVALRDRVFKVFSFLLKSSRSP
jgi:hypothetical protein